ncbi:helix-turn-helix DNA binding domain protein [Arthrobacter phage AbbyDaisy]|nr:helix-turn-helix DNA binding domain protein [Arthrobacter phage AbbyDaisy]
MNKRADLAAQAMTPEWPTRSEDFKQIRRHMARKALVASDTVMFSNANIARVVKATGVSIQTVNAVIRELRAES